MYNMVDETMKHKWDYSGLGEACYSDARQESYKKAAEFLGDDVEDWGCGTGWARQYFKKYHGIDGSVSRDIHEATDLVTYTSDADNILLREVLEYNTEWKQILDNVKKSFKKKFCLIVSTPFVEKTRIGFWHKSYNGGKIPEMYFNKKDLQDFFPDDEFTTREETITTDHLYHQDWIFYVERN